MKKILTVLFVAFLFAGTFSMSSCKKCTTCTYTYQLAGQDVVTYTYPELCGSNNDLDDYKNTCSAAAAIYGNECTCIDN